MKYFKFFAGAVWIAFAGGAIYHNLANPLLHIHMINALLGLAGVMAQVIALERSIFFKREEEIWLWELDITALVGFALIGSAYAEIPLRSGLIPKVVLATLLFFAWRTALGLAKNRDW